ncbi:MAG: hypothetical protein V4530_10200 [Pseudomonadota bacterium]
MTAFALPSAAAAAMTSSSLPGTWSVGETRNCASGPAWVFLADDYYVKVHMPDKRAVRDWRWRDEGTSIAYMHSYMRFSDSLTANNMKCLTIVERTADKLVRRNYRGGARVSPLSSRHLKSPAGRR